MAIRHRVQGRGEELLLTPLGADRMGTATAQGSWDETNRTANTLQGGSSSPHWFIARQEVKLTARNRAEQQQRPHKGLSWIVLTALLLHLHS